MNNDTSPIVLVTGATDGISTKLLKEGFGIDGASLEEGARTSIHCTLSEELTGTTGKYFVREAPTPSSKTSYDIRLRQDLWNLTMSTLGIPSGD